MATHRSNANIMLVTAHLAKSRNCKDAIHYIVKKMWFLDRYCFTFHLRVTISSTELYFKWDLGVLSEIRKSNERIEPICCDPKFSEPKKEPKPKSKTETETD
ncbi:hypothetical protein LguiB_002160 [Lonicera macranthoides]